MLKKTEPAVELFEDVVQGGDDWHELRRGIPTASVFATIMASGQDDGDSLTRQKLMDRLAGEILTGMVAETYRSKAMERGNEMEARAVAHYDRTHFNEPLRKVGFIRRKLRSTRYVGASPDRLIGTRKALEIKTMMPELMIPMLRKGAGMPPKHRAQVHGTMWVGDLDEVDLMIYYDGMPVAPKFTIARDNSFIKEISNAVEIFDHELHRLVEQIRAMGGAR